MNTDTGELRPYDEIPAKDRLKWVELKRDLTLKEKNERQIRLYAPCGCGSGKKFKFCCKGKPPMP